MANFTEYMQLCKALAAQAAQANESAVGSIIVKGGIVIAESTENSKRKNDITCHAEMEVIRLAVKKLKTNDLSQCTLISTHEPCIMCSYAIRYYGISRVVYRHASTHFGGMHPHEAVLSTENVPAHWKKAPEIVHFPY